MIVREGGSPSSFWHNVFAAVILFLCCVLAVTVRVFSVVKYESVIHEFDPYFNYRGTQYAVEHSLVDFFNWFDDMVWHPLGRHVGHTVYPGLMITASFVYHTARDVLHFPGLEIRNVCVFMAPMFSALTVIATFLLTSEVATVGAGLYAAAFMAIAPGYISRSVAGSYDNEGIAIFALVFVFYTFVKAVNTGSLKWAGFTSLAYFYMVLAWGGYIYIVNLIPAYTLGMMIIGRYSGRLYIAYSVWYTIGSLCAMQIPFVGTATVLSSTHGASHGCFVAVQLYAIIHFIRSNLSRENYVRLMRLAFLTIVCAGAVVGAVAYTAGFLDQKGTTRFRQLLDPSGDKIPILSSVSEHQATAWASYFFDLHILVLLVPLGGWACFMRWTDGALFLLAYGATSVYFSGIMIRLVLVLAPVACMLGGIGASSLLVAAFRIRPLPPLPEAADAAPEEGAAEGGAAPPAPGRGAFFWVNKSLDFLVNAVIGVGIVGFLGQACVLYVNHCVWVAKDAYSSPSIVMHGGDGMIDDFREAYRWLDMNTAPDAKIISWWDYGYQTTAMSNRSTIVDNNTWNNTHIATVGRAMASTETNAWPILKKLDVDYILVLFGGQIQYSSDDVNKFAWMVKISGGVFPEHVNEQAFQQFYTGKGASGTMQSCLMYKMCYYRFADQGSMYGRPAGYDSLRGEIGMKKFGLQYISEAFTSKHWLYRIYKVNKNPNRVPYPSTHYLP